MDPSGIPADVVIADYLGEMYPPYRWCEKLEVISQAQTQYNLKPILPEFYNILLERQDHDETGYSKKLLACATYILIVDPSLYQV